MGLTALQQKILGETLVTTDKGQCKRMTLLEVFLRQFWRKATMGDPKLMPVGLNICRTWKRVRKKRLTPAPVEELTEEELTRVIRRWMQEDEEADAKAAASAPSK